MLYHVTPGRNRKSIDKRGLLTGKTQGKLKAVWLVDASRLPWAFLHAAGRHQADPRTCVAYEVEVSPEIVKKSGREGLFYVLCDLPSYLLGSKLAFNQVSEAGFDAEDALLNTESAEQQANGARG